MIASLNDKVAAAFARSELAWAADSVRADGGRSLALGDAEVRHLTRGETIELERLGNTADDWSRVRVADGFNCQRVRHCHFSGDVLLGRLAGTVRFAEGVEFPSGIARSTLVNCVVGHAAFVSDVRLLAHYIVGEGAIVWDCGSVVCSGPTTFGNGQVLPLGPETGERALGVYAEITVEIVEALMLAPSRRAHFEEYERLLEKHVGRVTCDRGIIERGAVVRGTPHLQDSYVGPFAVVDGATLVRDCTLLSSADEPTQVLSGACVSSSLLQWGSRVAELAIVRESVLVEHAAAERHAKVSASILGPNTAVAEGEVTSALLGPFVGFHHQALAIAVIWPEGRGNISHGVSAGCNHTSRAPDQECWLGEGTFLGLGVQLKYPLDLRGAPYSVVAAGTALPPQKLDIPFSLIHAPTERPPGVSAALNEIVPAWVLTDNLYLLKRAEAKLRARNKARRVSFEFDVFRPEVVDRMRAACLHLKARSLPQEIYTERDLPGIGKNFLTESHRRRAVRTLQAFIRTYALRGLLQQAERARLAESALYVVTDDARWEHQRRLLVDELAVSDVGEALRELPDLLEQEAQAVERSKARDDERGRRIIADYADLHAPAERDPVVRACWDQTRRLQSEVKRLLLRWATQKPLSLAIASPAASVSVCSP
ncbi:MAG: DUF4954 family protein [Gemmataceae bacterium]|nr:DUF4954 family protein [Gemmataceae bacterium]